MAYRLPPTAGDSAPVVSGWSAACCVLPFSAAPRRGPAPTAYLMIVLYALYTHRQGPALTTPWLWPARPPHDLGGALCAGLVFIAEVALIAARDTSASQWTAALPAGSAASSCSNRSSASRCRSTSAACSSVIPSAAAKCRRVERQLVVAPVAEHYRTEQGGHRCPVRGCPGRRRPAPRDSLPPAYSLVVDVAEQLGQRTALDRHFRRAQRSQLVRYVDGRAIRVVQRLPREVVESGQRVGQLIHPAVLPGAGREPTGAADITS